MNEKRLLAILDKLGATDRFVTSAELSETLKVSSRTVRADVKDIVENVRGCELAAKPSAGFRLLITDPGEYEKSLSELKNKLSYRFEDDNEGRARCLVDFFICQDGYHRPAELEELLFVSDPVLKSCLRLAKDMLAEFNLELRYIQRRGWICEGRESDKRSCLVSLEAEKICARVNELRPDWALADIYESFSRMVASLNYNISHLAFQNLINSVYVILYRYAIQQKSLAGESFSVDTAKHPQELMLAGSISQYVESAIHGPLPLEEVKYIALCLICNRTLGLAEMLKQSSAEVYDLVAAMLERIRLSLGMDLRGDAELVHNLVSHLIPMVDRINNNVKLTNPLVGEIKTKYLLAYNCAVVGCGALEEKFGKKINEDEVGFIALLLSLSIERKKNDEKRKNILIVCASGQSSAKLLMYEIQHRFTSLIREVKTTTNVRLRDEDPRKWDYIFTTIKLEENYGIPTVLINSLVDADDIARIKNALSESKRPFLAQNYISEDLFFGGVDCAARESAISFIIKKTLERRNLPAEFERYVFEREEKGYTDFGNLIAMPHPYMPITEESFVSVAILKRPIVWRREKVQLIFLASVSKYPQNHTEQLFKAISRLIDSPAEVNKIIKNGSYEALTETLNKLSKSED